MQIRAFVVVVCLALLPLHARADSMSKHAKVKEIFRLAMMQNRMQQINEAAQVEAQSYAKAELAAYALPQAEAEETADYYKKVRAVVEQKYDWEKMEPRYEQVYVDVFTEKEIDGILAFYKTPAGQALISKTPELTKQLLEISKEEQESIKPQIVQLTKDHIARFNAAQKH